MGDKEFYAELMHRLNGPASRFEKAFTEAFKVEHPTLQQSLVRHLVVPALRVVGGQRPDARNSASYQFAQHALSDDTLLHFPTI